MATNPNPTPDQIPGFNSQIDNLQKQAGTYSAALANSPGSYSQGAPSAHDVQNQQELAKIQKSISALTDQKLKAQWYPPAPTGDSPGQNDVNPGIVGTALDYLSRPVRGMVGAVKHFTGQGTDSLTNDIADNMTKGNEYFGDVLKTSGLPSWAAAPLGFGLDIALDPVNWIGVGEAAMVPRIAGGLIRGGIEGATTAAKASVLEKAVTAGRYIPGFGTAFGEGTQAYAKLGEKALSATDRYEAATGQTMDAILSNGQSGVLNSRVPLSYVVDKIANAIPGGQKALSTLVYDPTAWVKQTVDMDIIKRAFGTAGVVDVDSAVKARLEDPNASIDAFMQPAKDVLASTPAQPHLLGTEIPADIMTQKEIDTILASLPPGLADKFSAVAPKLVAARDDLETINKSPKIGVNGDALTNGLRILNETGFGGGGLTLEDVAAVMKSGALGDTGVKWFDNMMQSIKDFRSSVDENGERIGGIGESTLKYYDNFMALFRGAVVGGSPVGHLNSIIGNAMMNHLGLGDTGLDYINTYRDVRSMYRGVSGSAAKLQGQLMQAAYEGDTHGAEVLQWIKDNPGAMRGTVGDVSSFTNAKERAAMLLQSMVADAGRATGFNTEGLTADELAHYMDAGEADLEQFRKSLPKGAEPEVLAGTSIVRKMKGKLKQAEVPNDMVSQELFEKESARKMFDYIAEQAKNQPNNPFWKVMDVVYNKMSNAYATHDQISKMTTFIRSTRDGYTKAQILRARHLIELAPEDISTIERDGIKYHRLNGRKAIELANTLYMNYAAMPSAVRVLRNMPLLGNPFVSFMYGMALKSGQTLAYNPSAFNKVTTALHEFGGTPTPLERQALNDPSGFYSYLKQPGMFRVPFTDDNPIYINLANMIPYYSMNMFNPSQQSYDTSTLSASFAQAVASSPFVKDPLGAILFNNVVQPAILSEGIQPQGQFGQALWPSDADFLTKLGYTARDLAGTVTPGIASFAGLAGGMAAPGLTQFSPSYKYRVLSNAVQGKNVYGITGKEPAASRTIRGIASGLGVPVQAPVNLTFTNNSNNNQ